MSPETPAAPTMGEILLAYASELTDAAATVQGAAEVIRELAGRMHKPIVASAPSRATRAPATFAKVSPDMSGPKSTPGGPADHKNLRRRGLGQTAAVVVGEVCP